MHAPLPPMSRVALTSDGAIEGYASLFGEVDQARDMVMPGAFAQTLEGNEACARSRCCSSTIPASRSGSGLRSRRIGAGFARGAG